MSATVIVNPTGGEPPRTDSPAPVLADLAGRTIGFLSNSKMNAEVVLGAVAQALAGRHGITPMLYTKRVPSIGADPALLDEIARSCDAAVVALLDCGSCASWACADLVELTGRGLPVCGMTTGEFDAFSRQVLRMKDAGGIPLSVLVHPIGGISPAEAERRVSGPVIDEVELALTGAAPAGEPGGEAAPSCG